MKLRASRRPPSTTTRPAGGRGNEGRQPTSSTWSTRRRPATPSSSPPDPAELAVKPAWDAKGEPTSFQIDHILEYQLGGGDDADQPLASRGPGQHELGSPDPGQVAGGMKEVFADAKEAGPHEPPRGQGRGQGGRLEVLREGDLQEGPWLSRAARRATGPLGRHKKGEPLKLLRAMTPEEMKAAGGTPGEARALHGPRGRRPGRGTWGEKRPRRERDAPASWWFHLTRMKASQEDNNNFEVDTIALRRHEGRQITGTLFKEDKTNTGRRSRARPRS